jgi:rhamnosyltransferase
MQKSDNRIAIIMRSFNDINVIEQTLAAVSRQRGVDFTLWNFDSTSTDGTLEVIRRFNEPERIHLNDSTTYNPGRILNEAVRVSEGELIVFLNSDATPTSDHWLERLIEPFTDPNVGAVFGRQVARPDCRSLFVKDTERAFGDGDVAAGWVHFFSMANSAVRRDLVTRFPFDTRIQYSEDIDWSYRLKRLGKRIAYVPEAAAMHSHNYSLRESYRRQFGEGVADAWIYRRGEVSDGFLRCFLAPFGMEIWRDLGWAASRRSLDALLHTIPLRFVQKWARWRGLRNGNHIYANC